MSDGAAPDDAVGTSRSGILIVVVVVLTIVVLGDFDEEVSNSSGASP
ncbi:MAG: hypothetical protein ACKOIA_07035 [Acidimicrobiia bacterium]